MYKITTIYNYIKLSLQCQLTHLDIIQKINIDIRVDMVKTSMMGHMLYLRSTSQKQLHLYGEKRKAYDWQCYHTYNFTYIITTLRKLARLTLDLLYSIMLCLLKPPLRPYKTCNHFWQTQGCQVLEISKLCMRFYNIYEDEMQN